MPFDFYFRERQNELHFSKFLDLRLRSLAFCPFPSMFPKVFVLRVVKTRDSNRVHSLPEIQGFTDMVLDLSVLKAPADDINPFQNDTF